jgi:superfamily I DNA and/or RNA helicase
MDPAIAQVISDAFYKGQLGTHPTREAEALKSPPFVHSAPLGPSPVLVVDFEHVSSSGKAGQMERGRPRWHNLPEIDAVVEVLKRIRARPDSDKRPTLAVLSPYNAQVDRLHSRITGLLKTDLAHLSAFAPVRKGASIVDTVDAFQGSEADLVVISLVRNNPRTGAGALGFLRDKRRMNVALSRAKSQLVIVGSLSFLGEAVRGVNPDDTEHDLSFLTTMIQTIRKLESEKRGNPSVHLAQIISPQKLRGSR